MYATICILIAVAMFMTYLDAGRQREATIRCVACGSRAGEKHHRDCQYKDRG